MPKKDGAGPKGKGPMTGFGSGKCIIPRNTEEEEMTFLKNQETVLRKHLGTIEARIVMLESTSSKNGKK
jgi:hypothetical protein